MDNKDTDPYARLVQMEEHVITNDKSEHILFNLALFGILINIVSIIQCAMTNNLGYIFINVLGIVWCTYIASTSYKYKNEQNNKNTKEEQSVLRVAKGKTSKVKE